MGMRIAVVFVMALVFLAGCANKVAPTGGTKDVAPPKILSAAPPSGTVGFSSGQIQLNFDEYIQLKEASQQITISPPVPGNPLYSARKKSVIIEFDSLPVPNTTYNINFGSAICDINEGNVLQDFQYVFSTGNTLDSMELRGTISDALTLKPAPGAHAVLFNESVSDSSLLRTRPSYMARSNESGEFLIKNIAPGRYRLLALEEKNPDLKLNGADEKAGFHPALVTAGDSAVYDLRIYKPVSKQQGINTCQISPSGMLTMTFLRPADTVRVQWLSASPDSVTWLWSLNRDSLFGYMNPVPADSIRLVVSGLLPLDDTLNCRRSLTGRLVKQPAAAPAYSFYPPDGGLLIHETVPALIFTAPVQIVDTSKISIVNTDSLLVRFNLQVMGTKIEFIIQGDDQGYSVNLLPGAVRDFYGRENDTIRRSFSRVEERSTGSVSIRLKTIIPERGILQLVDEKEVVIRERMFSSEYNTLFERLNPGKYRFRIISDRNGNGKWDPGDHWSQTLPEEVIYYRDILMVRANWEVEAEW